MENKKKGITAILFATILIASVFAVTPTAQAASKADINNAIADGITWLVAQQQADGSWGSSNKEAHTGLAVLKLETYAIEQGLSPFDPSYVYHTNVEDGLDYIFANTHQVTIVMQPAGNPDTNGNGFGIYLDSWSDTYQTSIGLMAIAASDAPNRVVTTGPETGRTYAAVAQDIVDYLAWSQTDATCWGQGGWGYNADDDCWSDNSNTGYAVLGLGYAEAPSPWGFGLTIPAFVRTEHNIWVGYIQCTTPGGNFGGSGYTDPNGWVNTLKTGNLLYEQNFVGDIATTPRVQNAMGYLVNHWNDANQDPGWKDGATTSNYQATYTIMKGLEAMNIDTIGTIDWYDDISNEIVAEQNGDGSWSGCDWGNPILCTCWALLALEKAVPPTWLSLTPLTDTNQLGTSHELTATLTDMTGGIPGETVTFTVTAGPHSGETGTDVTDANGEATWSYTGTIAGTDTIVATGGGKTSNDAFKIWEGPGERGNCCACPAGTPDGCACTCMVADDEADCRDNLKGIWVGADGCDITTNKPCDEYTCEGEECIPEFSTIAIPVASILGLLFYFNYRKRKREQ